MYITPIPIRGARLQDYSKVCPHPDFLHFGAPGQMESKQILTPLWKGFTLNKA